MHDSSNTSTHKNIALTIGGILSLLASLIHFAAIIGGPDWYRFFGAGEEMAQMAERGEAYPIIVTCFIGAVLAIWAAYAFAGAGLIRRLPFMRFCLVGISLVYLSRAFFGIGFVIFMDNPYLLGVQQDVKFLFISSLIVLAYGFFYALGTAQVWPVLSPKKETDQDS